jgi:hypothetical protein
MLDFLQQQDHQYKNVRIGLLYTIIHYILYYILNFTSNGNLGTKVGIEIAKHDALCQAYDPFSFARLMCSTLSVVIVPFIVTSTLMVFLLMEYAMISFLILLKFICGSWCDAVH